MIAAGNKWFSCCFSALLENRIFGRGFGIAVSIELFWNVSATVNYIIVAYNLICVLQTQQMNSANAMVKRE